MTLTISTTVFRDAATRAAHVAHGCRWWLVNARVLTLGQQAHPLAASVQRVSAVADRSERLARELGVLAQKYDDHEGSMGRILQVLSAGAVVSVLAPWLPLGALGLEALIATGVICREGVVTVRETGVHETSAPQGVDGLLARIPQGADQVRIDTVENAGATSYVIYISGTRDFSPIAGSQPWDLTSGFHGLSGDEQSGCERAVREAMREAGIVRGDRVVLVGHSLGGLTAMRMAQSGDFDVSDLVTVGAPIHPLTLDAPTRVTVLEHTDDLVPAVSGVALATSALTIRSSFGRSTSGLWGAHDISSYRATAREIDQSRDVLVSDRRSSLASATSGDRVTSRWFRATRQLN